MNRQPVYKAFYFAFSGIRQFFLYDRNARIHAGAAMAVAAAGIFFKITPVEWCVLLLCIVLVISLEMMNYALEKLCDTVHPGHHPLIKVAKDVAAAAVLWSSIISAVIGTIIFLPRLSALL